MPKAETNPIPVTATLLFKNTSYDPRLEYDEMGAPTAIPDAGEMDPLV
jgi:hypothetical protein